MFRVALANLRFPGSGEESVELAVQAIAAASQRGSDLICFPECYVPGYRAPDKMVAMPDREFLERAWERVATAAREGNVAVVLGTERLVDGALLATALVVDRSGEVLGFQDKVQLDPSEEGVYSPGSERRLFQSGPLRFGVVICHEGWRYPETVRWAAERRAQVVFHPQFHEAADSGYVAASFGDPANTFHEKAMLCRAAENNCYFVSVNCVSAGSATTSAVVGPEGELMAWQPYGEEGLLVVDLDLEKATGLLASRLKR